MKAQRIIVIVLIFVLNNIKVTASDSLLNRLTITKLSNLSASDSSYQDLMFLKSVLKDNRIVLLGEQSHGEGATFEAKVKLVRFLHQELGYDLICFESGMFDNYYANKIVSSTNAENSIITQSVFPIWSQTIEFRPLIEYIHQQRNGSNPLIIAGFDCQEDVLFKENFVNELSKHLASRWKLTQTEIDFMQDLIEAEDDLLEQPNDFATWNKVYAKIMSTFEKFDLNSSMDIAMLKQIVRSWNSYLLYKRDEGLNIKTSIQNPRDEAMANNLIALAKLYPDKKIICWGASYHFANMIHKVNLTSTSSSKMKNMSDEKISDEELHNYYKDAKPMGQYLKREFGNQLYSIAFSSYQGNFGMIGSDAINFSLVQPPLESLEYKLQRDSIQFAFVELNNAVNSKQAYYQSVLGNIPMEANWGDVFDATIFIRNSFCPHIYQQIKHKTALTSSNTDMHVSTNRASKQVVCKTSNLPIEYVHVVSKASNYNQLTNYNGEFSFDLSSLNPTDSITFSSIGYESLTTSVDELQKHQLIVMKPATRVLKSVTIIANQLSAKEIVMKAEQKISTNHIQTPYQQRLFYRYTTMNEDTLNELSEKLVKIKCVNGLKSGKRQLLDMNILHENLYVNESNSKMKNGDSEIDERVFGLNVLTSRNNPLHRVNYYEYTNKGIINLNDKRVYEIEFRCTKPCNTAIGLGRDPKSSSGVMYIEVGNYALLKFVQHVVCESHHIGTYPNGITNEHIHEIVQLFDEVNGQYAIKYFKNIQINKRSYDNQQRSFHYFRSLEYKHVGFESAESIAENKNNGYEFDKERKNFMKDDIQSIYNLLP